jgi:hypothetical protein
MTEGVSLFLTGVIPDAVRRAATPRRSGIARRRRLFLLAIPDLASLVRDDEWERGAGKNH